MSKMVMAVAVTDIRRVRIHCRCSRVSVAEIPVQISAGMNLHVCPNCGGQFLIQQQQNRSWKIERVPVPIADSVFKTQH